MLLDHFFTIQEQNITNNTLQGIIHFDASHPIFKGHFPEQPVVPGVCMMQTFTEMLEKVLDKKMQLQKADQLKFLAVINPLENAAVNVEFTFEEKEDGTVSVNGRLFKAELNFLKFRGAFITRE